MHFTKSSFYKNIVHHLFLKINKLVEELIKVAYQRGDQAANEGVILIDNSLNVTRNENLRERFF